MDLLLILNEMLCDELDAINAVNAVRHDDMAIEIMQAKNG